MTATAVLLLIISSVLAHIDFESSLSTWPARNKRGASGALHIVTNHAQPIHADVKSETPTDNAVKGEKPCLKGSGPAHVEPGVGFKVTPPEDGLRTYEQKSLRKSLPFAPPSTITLIRSISRIVTLLVLFIAAISEFYPTFYLLFSNIINFMYAK